jgi:hypothetical protein
MFQFLQTSHNWKEIALRKGCLGKKKGSGYYIKVMIIFLNIFYLEIY